MKKWMKYGSIGVCFWSLLLILVGVSQLTYGAYYISKLPVFKIGSPVWIGFLNILCAAGLFALHHKTLGLRESSWFSSVDSQAEPSKRKRSTPSNGSIHQPIAEPVPAVQPSQLYWSICLCGVIVFINIANAIICEVGEWQHWISHSERDQLRTSLSVLAIQAHRVTAAQMSLAIIIGVICTGLNVWLVYKHRQTCVPTVEAGQSVQTRQTTVDQAVSNSAVGTHRPRKVSVSPSAGYDNPNWVYGENGSNNSSQGVLLHPEPENRRPVSVSVISDGGGGMRYATIRRAPSILMALPPEHHFAPQRIHLKSASFRFGGERDPQFQRQNRAAAKVNRSKTMRETSFTTSSPCNVKSFETTHTFAQRFQSSLDGTSALSFVHDISGEEEEEEEATGGISVASTAPVADSPPPKTPVRSQKVESGMQTTVEADVMQEEEEELPAQLPVVRQQVRSSDRIILRVESFRTTQSSPMSRTPTHTPAPPAVHRPHPGTRNNVKRVSSSTQTELSVLKASSFSPVGQQQRTKRSVLHHTQYQGSKVKVGGAVTSQAAGTTTTLPHISPVESSSGYSSPRGTESKSPTPEPTLQPGQQQDEQQQSTVAASSQAAPVNVTVIQIDPKPMAKKEFQPRVTDVTYAIPRKRSERNTPTGNNNNESTPTPELGFQVSIQSKPVHRSVSFHHMSQAGRRAVYGNEWLNAGSLLGNHLPPLVMSIPRPALRNGQQNQRYTTPSSSPRRASNNGNLPASGSSLSRSTSMYLAMSEIQRKLDLLQVLGTRHHLTAPTNDAVPVHREMNHNNYDDFYSHGSPSHSEGSRRSRGRPTTRQQQPPPAPPPPPPPPPIPLSSNGISNLDLNDSLDSAKTLAYLSELETLARHWRTQLLYKVELKSSSKRMGTVLENDSFQC